MACNLLDALGNTSPGVAALEMLGPVLAPGMSDSGVGTLPCPLDQGLEGFQ